MLTIDSFGLDHYTSLLFCQEEIKDLRTVVLMLEQYKALSRDQIIKTIATQISIAGESVKATQLQSVDTIGGNVEHLNWLESRYNILLSDNDNIITVYSDVMAEVDDDAIELALFGYKFERIYLTPWNYLLLAASRGYTSLPEFEPVLLFKRIIVECIKINATDVHFVVEHRNMKPEYHIRYRVARQLLELNLFELDSFLNESIVKQVISSKTTSHGLDLSSANGIQTVITDLFGDGTVDIRFTANTVLAGIHYVGRIQMKRTTSMQIEQLGFPARTEQALHLVAKKRSGLTLITGEQCTGKNTTAFAIANEMVKMPIKIVDFSSPVEVLMPFSQTDYQADDNYLINLTRLVKKQDTDVVFLNEIPSHSTALAVRELVNSSIHVLTTTHIDRIWHLPYKLYEFYGEEYKHIISQINAVVNQKMFSVLCDKCAQQILTSSVQDVRHRAFLEKFGVQKVSIPVGCPCCTSPSTQQMAGFKIGVNKPFAEVLIFTQELKSELLRCKEVYEMEEVMRKRVMEDKLSLEYEIASGIAKGLIDTSAIDSLV